jgi:mono/diheme cytochrome c family protein
MKKLILVFAALIVFSYTVAAQGQMQDQTKTTIQHVPIKPTSPASGKEMFVAYCAACHGTDGKGGGPAASALKVAPANLTQLSKNNGGKYPALKVAAIIHGESAPPAHGSSEMPVWGPLFRTVSGGHDEQVEQRVSNLTHYIETLQAK